MMIRYVNKVDVFVYNYIPVPLSHWTRKSRNERFKEQYKLLYTTGINLGIFLSLKHDVKYLKPAMVFP